MKCEVCDSPAIDRTPADYDGVKIDCPTCGKYAVAGTALNGLRVQEPVERMGVMLRAKRRALSDGRTLIATTEL